MGRRPVYGGIEKFQTDPHWRDYILFFEYFHGDNGAGLGASHQTGWTGLVAKLIELYGFLDPEQVLEQGQEGSVRRGHHAPAEAERLDKAAERPSVRPRPGTDEAATMTAHEHDRLPRDLRDQHLGVAR